MANAGRLRRFCGRASFDVGILLPNSFDSALVFRLAGIPQIIGYSRDMRRYLLTHRIPAPVRNGAVHERFYYLELLQKSGLIDGFHGGDKPIVLDCAAVAASEGQRIFAEQGVALPIIGVSPGAAYGSAKCWYPERFAETAAHLASRSGGTVVLFGASGDADTCAGVEQLLIKNSVPVVNLAGKTNLRQFIDLAAACSVFLSNDSGAMHVASALGVPTVAVFGATSHQATGPAGPVNSIVREHVDCSPCFQRECPIDHRCMTAVTVDKVVSAALTLIDTAQVNPSQSKIAPLAKPSSRNDFFNPCAAVESAIEAGAGKPK